MTRPADLPMHLEHYDFLAALELWRAAGADRWWELTPAVSSPLFRCRLAWPGQTWVCRIDKFAASVPEAVWLAMEEWNRTPTRHLASSPSEPSS